MTDRIAIPRICAVIMAGGVGTRFWPRSREKFPKHLLQIIGKDTMLQQTVRRLEPIVDPRDVFIVTNRLQRAQIVKQLPRVPEENIIVEPVGRNTAPCIGLAALHVHRLDPEAVMIVLPADHLIQEEEGFRSVLQVAVNTAAQAGGLITIGMTPTHPETGYGYIQYVNERTPDNPFFDAGVRKVKTFAEKPNLQTAEQFLASGDFLWNSGMFVWKAETILKEIARTLPDLSTELSNISAEMGTSRYPGAVETAYGIIRGISIDYGVMEKSDRVYVIPSSFGWNDIGSWDEVYRVGGKDERGNSITGKVIQKETNNSFIYSPDKVVAAIGVDDLIIVNTDDALLICKRGRSQEVKEIADYLKRKQMNDLL
jgi:mannose-1-phosphate guanylyltransferase